MRSDLKNNMINRVGERLMMNCGEEAEIIDYRDAKKITIKFIKTGELVQCEYNNFKRKTVKSRLIPTILNIGIVGSEKIIDENNKVLDSYITWVNMIKRCYSLKRQEKQPTYKECTMCKEWLYYPNFKKWYDENYYEIEGQRIHVDKDILFKNNKVYSPENCVFAPICINSLFTKCNKSRGDLPIGVTLRNSPKTSKIKYRSRYNIFDIDKNKTIIKHLGYFNTPEEAFNTYKQFKESYIKQVADYYKEQIPKKLYDAMYKYEVEITD